MIDSRAYPAQITSEVALPAVQRRSYFALQNHDPTNSVNVKFNGKATQDSVITTPNGMVVKAGEFGEINGQDVSGEITIISEVAPVNTTLFEGPV